MERSNEPIDRGRNLHFVADGAEHRLFVAACVNPLCECDHATVALAPGELGEVRFDLQVSTRIASAHPDVPDMIPSLEQMSWFAGIMQGEVGDRVMKRVERDRRQYDRRSWQRLDWTLLEGQAFVANEVLFPDDAALATFSDGRWARDLYCLRGGCDCSDVRLEVRDARGVIGTATLRIANPHDPTVVACDSAVRELVDLVCEDGNACSTLHRRHREARGVARMRKTWVADSADPARVAARLAATTGAWKPLDEDVAYYLGGRIIEPLARISRDAAAPVARRVRAVRLLGVIGERAVAEPLLEALGSEWLLPAVGRGVFGGLLEAFVRLKSAARAAVLARIAPDSPGEVVRVAIVLGVDDPRVWAALARYVERDPIAALRMITPEIPDGAALAHGALERALDAQPPEVDVARAALDALDAMHAKVPKALRARVVALEEPAMRAALAPMPPAPSWISQLGSSSAPPPGRNRPCPCGSGKKAKVCCARD